LGKPPFLERAEWRRLRRKKADRKIFSFQEPSAAHPPSLLPFRQDIPLLWLQPGLPSALSHLLTVASFRTWRGLERELAIGTRPSSPLERTLTTKEELLAGIQPRIGGFRVQGTASSPPSAAESKKIIIIKERAVKMVYNSITFGTP